jgi:hypothetical protein
LPARKLPSIAQMRRFRESSASPNAQPLGFIAWLKPSEVEAPASTSTDDRRFRLAPPMGQFSRSGRTANLSDDEGFPFLRKISAASEAGDWISLSTAMEMTTMTMPCETVCGLDARQAQSSTSTTLGRFERSDRDADKATKGRMSINS